MIIYKCDKCEKRIEGNVFDLILLPHFDGEVKYSDRESFHLCAKCVGNFGLWMIDKEKSKDTRTEQPTSVQTDGEKHTCSNCKHGYKQINDEPCHSCDLSIFDKWEAYNG